MTSAVLDKSVGDSGPKPLTEGKQPLGIMIALWAFVIIPFVALIAAVPVAWGGWLGWSDVAIAVVMYYLAGLGVTIGFHRYLTHGSFKAKRWLRVTLAVAGSLALQGSVVQWVADHRRHHAYSDIEGDPHSPWRFGNTLWGLTKGLFFAHMGWLFYRELSNRARFAPDLLADKDIARVDRFFPLITITSLLAPALAGGLVTWSWQGALSAFFWAGLVRISLLHHVTWAINSICHVVGERPFELREGDKATNFWPLAILSFGESWHNLHHADPTCARHGVLRGQIDFSARTIWFFEKFGWVRDVRWPKPERIAAKLVR
ncbi:MAG: acyl-CoA desaturase [Actinobacteria bacterium 13_1_20CM_3_71_11]|nr:MAG: acyl-CoA desaturase [Actinobacteria bacterium 13_1_20CM_3_71_11]TML21523.1 MAG: acyl-CoA desaturase [Actinomycetota bacterium]